MLIVYLEPFKESQIELLSTWQDRVSYWPRSSVGWGDERIPTDWWMLFYRDEWALVWLLRYQEHCRIMRTLFD